MLPEELDFAAALKTTFPPSELPGSMTAENFELRKFVMEATQNGTRPINDFVMPYVGGCPYSCGSTDVGDVSWLTPVGQINTATWPSGSPGHSWQNVSVGKSGIAHKGLLYASKILAGAVAELMEDEAILKEARAEFDITAAAGYDCPLGPEVVAGPQ